MSVHLRTIIGMNFRQVLCRILSLVMLIPGIVSAGTEIYTTLADEYRVPTEVRQTEFLCTNQIYTVVELEEYAEGAHQLRARWFTPSGDLSHGTKYDFTVLNPLERVWAWLKLHRENGAGLLRMIDPSAGMEAFIGEWKVRIDIDNAFVGEALFEVLC